MQKRFLKSYYLIVKGWWWWKANIMNERANDSVNPFHTKLQYFLCSYGFFVHTFLGRPYESTINFSFSWSPSYPVLNDAMTTTLQHQLRSALL